MFGVPELEFAFIGSDDRIVHEFPITTRTIEDTLLISKNKGTNASKPRSLFENLGSRGIWVEGKVLFHDRTWPHEAHLPHEYIDQLWQFVDLRLSKEIPDG